RFADAVPIFWDWVVRQFAVEGAELIPSLVASWKAGTSDDFVPPRGLISITPEPASGPPPEPFLGRIVGRDYRSWVAARLQPSGTSVPATPAVVPKAQPLTTQSETESDGPESLFDTPPSSPVAGGSAKRSSDGLGPGKAKKTRKTPTVPHGVQVLAHDDLPSSVVAAYEEVVAARPWERYLTQASFVPESLRGDPDARPLHLEPVVLAEVDKLLPLLVTLAGCLFRVYQRHGGGILHFLSYPHSFWPVYLSQGITLRGVVRRHGEAEAIRYLREGGTQWWPEVPTLVKSRSWRAPDNATLTYLHKRELKPGTAAKFDPSRVGVTQDVVRRSITAMLEVINSARQGVGPSKPFPFLVASYSQPPVGSQWSSSIPLQHGTRFVATSSLAAPSQAPGATGSQASSSSVPPPAQSSSDGSICL
ncbi:hypothetical protein AaE_013372, partial [Aphanomyces astaci]